MKILYIDTTSNYLYAALAEESKITGKISLKLEKDLSVFTLAKIKHMLVTRNLQPDQIDKIIVVNGPGSFTGIRIGITIAKVYAWALKKPITAISSLEVMALSSKQDTMYKVPIIDARREYVFAGIYDNENHLILQNQYIKLATLLCILEQLPGNYSIISNQNFELQNQESYLPDFAKIINRYKDQEEVNPHSVNPIYLKLTEAEEKKQVDIL